ncbi:hypothetical protein GCM10010466_66350 [Planomonospora alba]|uniref:Uncharacterized protein n=1 Tax=Planomonospora alba TaxID=161354 RepID=A0ABP6P4L5_9ACTN
MRRTAPARQHGTVRPASRPRPARGGSGPAGGARLRACRGRAVEPGGAQQARENDGSGGNPRRGKRGAPREGSFRRRPLSRTLNRILTPRDLRRNHFPAIVRSVKS